MILKYLFESHPTSNLSWAILKTVAIEVTWSDHCVFIFRPRTPRPTSRGIHNLAETVTAGFRSNLSMSESRFQALAEERLLQEQRIRHRELADQERRDRLDREERAERVRREEADRAEARLNKQLMVSSLYCQVRASIWFFPLIIQAQIASTFFAGYRSGAGGGGGLIMNQPTERRLRCERPEDPTLSTPEPCQFITLTDMERYLLYTLSPTILQETPLIKIN